MKKIASLIALAVCTNVFSAPSQDSLWNDVEEPTVKQFKSAAFFQIKAFKKRSLSLDENALKQKLFNSTGIESDLKKARSGSNKPTQPEIDLPLPNGDYIRVRVIESPVLSPELSENYPEIKTWRVLGVDDPSITGRIDYTSSGFHGMLVLEGGETIFIDPDKDGDGNTYSSFSKLENAAHFHDHINCEIHDSHTPITTIKSAKFKPAKIPAAELITYRLAVAGTAEYTSALGGQTSAYNSMITTINRVNEIYQRDLGVKLELVNDESLLYTDSTTDPYTNNSTQDLLNENMANMESTFGAANYDVGHVFADGVNGGLAYIGVACLNQANVEGSIVNGIKAGGASGFFSPEGETFSIDLVAHEIGHQLGANHTFNGTGGFCGGNINTGTAVEPGGGSTIMSYSGNCGADSFQASPDAMFHWNSISEINEYTRNDFIGSSCGVRTSTGNEAPVADAGSNHVIPVNTPFLLDGEAITGSATYTWDQMDSGTASSVDVDEGDNAIIRTTFPNVNPDRYIPRLSDLFSGSNTEGEMLPQTVRNLNFSFVVRDGNGEIANDLKLISTENTGETFRVLSHNTNETLSTGQTINVLWDVASTQNAPINCSTVNIQLLREDGIKNNLLMNTNNDGAESLVVPAGTPTMTDARIMVGCATQPFFQISAGEISIQQSLDTTAPVITVTGSSTIDVMQSSTYNDLGATATDDFDGIVSVSPSGAVDTAIVGTYIITYTAVDNAGNSSSEIRTVNVIPDTVAPEVTLIGASTVSLFEGQAYVEQGATASDNVDINVSVDISGSVDTETIGEYVVTYSAIDNAGNAATDVIRTVTILEDTIAPVITLFGNSTISVEKDTIYSDDGASATDNVDLSVSVVTTGLVDTSIVGTYTITYSATDNAGNSSTSQRIINVIETDLEAPIITLTGASTVSLFEGQAYVEQGATATDNVDTNVSVDISGSVDTNLAGEYVVTYSAIDSAGNAATDVIRTVTILEDTIAPIITIFGNSTISVEKDTIYADAGASAIDNVDSSVSVVTTGSVDTTIVGTYTITYSATDNAGNSSTSQRTINVIETDLEAPIITLTGASTVFLFEGQAYVEQGATVTDNVDTNVSVVISGSVDTNSAGEYVVTYSATDSAGNAATNVIRTVTIAADTTAPVITLLGNSTITIEKDAIYTDAGASATDNVDSSVVVVTSGVVDTSTVGVYEVIYSATDNAGNLATPVIRFVNVVSTEAPIVSEDEEVNDEESSSNEDNTSKPPVVTNVTSNASSGGGSFSFLLLPLAMIALRRRISKLES